MRYPWDEPGVYAIRVAGKVNDSWSDCLGGLAIVTSESSLADSSPATELTGPLPDQAALYGVLNTLYDYGYPLLHVQYLGPVQTKTAPSSQQ